MGLIFSSVLFWKCLILRSWRNQSSIFSTNPIKRELCHWYVDWSLLLLMVKNWETRNSRVDHHPFHHHKYLVEIDTSNYFERVVVMSRQWLNHLDLPKNFQLVLEQNSSNRSMLLENVHRFVWFSFVLMLLKCEFHPFDDDVMKLNVFVSNYRLLLQLSKIRPWECSIC